MEYTEDQLTEWFDVEKVKPTQEGAYEVFFKRGNDGFRMWSYWDSKNFNSGWLTPDRSYEHKDFKHLRSTSSTQPIQWRGLKSNPQAPQKPAKKKGNKRKTMYVVMLSYTSRNYGKPLATFTSKKFAEEYLEKEVDMQFFPLHIEKIRFRTPEA